MRNRKGIFALLGALSAPNAWGIGALGAKLLVAVLLLAGVPPAVKPFIAAAVVAHVSQAPPEPLIAEDGILDDEATRAEAAVAIVESLPNFAAAEITSPEYRAKLDEMIATIRTAIQSAAEKKRAEITASLSAMAQQYSAQSARLKTLAAAAHAVAQPFLAEGARLKNRGESIRALGRRCFYDRRRDNAPVTVDLGPGIVSLGVASENAGFQLRDAATIADAAAVSLEAAADSLTVLVQLIEEGGRDISVFKTHFANAVSELTKAGQSEIDMGNVLVAIGVEQERAGNGLHAMAQQFGEYADCRMSNYVVLGPFAWGDIRRARDARYRGIERRLAVRGDASFAASTGTKARGGALIEEGTHHGALLQSVADLLRDNGRFSSFADNFSGCPLWIGKQPQATRSPVESDTHGRYNVFAATHPTSGHIALRIDGTFPRRAPYLSFATYATATGYVQSFAANQSIKTIAPDINPYSTGDPETAAAAGYRIYALPKGSPYLNRLSETTLELPPDANFTIVNRVYDDRSVPVTELPKVWAVSASDLRRPVMCPGRPTVPIDVALSTELPPVSPVIRFYRQLSSRIFFPDGMSTGACSSGYLLANLPADTVDVIEFNKKPQPQHAAYFSVGAVGSTLNPATTVINGKTLYGNISGREMMERNGRVTIALIPDSLPPLEKRLAIEAALQAGHVNLMTKPADAHLVYRVKVPADFAGNPEKAPCNPKGLASVSLADAAIGDYFPVGQSYPIDDFIRGVSLMSADALKEERFIWNLYRALLGRSPALSEMAAWLRAPGGANWFVTVLRGVQYSAEANLRLVSEMVTNLRVANEGANLGYRYDYWTVAKYYANKSTLPCEALVQALYKTFLKRPEVPYGMWYGYCENQNDNVSRSQVIQGIIESLEAQNVLVNYYYNTYLNRSEPAGSPYFTSYVNMIQRGVAHHDIGYNFGLSTEFLDKPPVK